MFSPTSRYSQVSNATYTAPDGTEIVYKRRRFPPMQQQGIFGQTGVRPEERVDQLAARTLRDPLQYWRLCDTNMVLDPFELVDEPGRRVRVPLALVPEPR
ncbi:LysM domain-containing protein [Corallococcus aberystwythensis]|uniref:LysM domain-containing protein n=1 Tax=Corallococcus aberystwythensis TaxID=2316722 RepID=A0A3A8PEZ8_9BACT|nr:LysM domain-containing protein [Corallococcus aberystwythensis]RKH54936.1 LysM domain-containing protein [Corallococcus aberystwythensis]